MLGNNSIVNFFCSTDLLDCSKMCRLYEVFLSLKHFQTNVTDQFYKEVKKEKEKKESITNNT